MAETNMNTDDDKVVRGAAAIARLFDPPMTLAATYYHLEEGNIPASKLGNTKIWVTTRRKVREAALTEKTVVVA
jgi:hypothetical protein